MQKTLVLVAVLVGMNLVSAQEQLPRTEALKIAFYLTADMKRVEGTPIPTDVDLKYPVAVREGDYGGMVLPECKLSADTLAKAGSAVVPVGQLWLHKLTVLKDGDPVPGNKLQSFTIPTEQESATGVRCALGFKQNGSSGPELLIYGKDKEPILNVPLKKIESSAKTPIEITADHSESDAAKVTLKIAGRYEGSFKVTELPE